MKEPHTATKKSSHFFAVFGIGLGILVGCSDWSIVQNTLPSIQRSLGASLGEMQWVMNSFGLFMTALLVTMGKIGDIIGRRKLYYIGISLFSLSSLAAGLSPNSLFLIFARAFQGASFAIILPISQALLTHVYPEEEHGKAMGIWATLAGVGLCLGPALGGIIVAFLSWRWIFYINIPFSILSIILVSLFVKESKNEEISSYIDSKGMALFILTLGSLIFIIIQAPDWGFTHPALLLSFAIFVLSFIFFYRNEQKTKEPFLSFSLFKNRRFVAAAIGIAAACFLFWSTFFVIPIYLQNYRNDSPLVSGLMLLFVGISFSVFSRFAGIAADRVSKRKLLSSGLLLLFLTMLSFALLKSPIPLPFIACLLFLFGTGEALVWSPATSFGISALPRNYSGLASGSITTLQETGGALGLALAGSIFRMTEKYHYSTISSTFSMNISKETLKKAKSLLSDPEKFHTFLNTQSFSIHQDLLSLLKKSLLFGFHSAIFLIAATAFIAGALLFFLLKKKE